jgi:PAS domain S-box-containing protein
VNILIVDDEPINQKLLHATLEAEGHIVTEAADGVEALQVLECQGADAIISDILMPRMDGYRFCSEVRKRKQFEHLPFIHYTATYISSNDEKLSADLGADVFLRKPASADEIICALRHVTSEGHQVRAISPAPESDVMKEYSERLVAKLEHKNLELARASHDLENERSRLRHLLEHSPAVIYALKIEGQRLIPVVVSENIERLLGVTAAEATSYDWWAQSLHPEDRARAVNVRAKSLTEEGYSVEYRIRHKDGSYHWVEDNNRVVRDPSGSPTESVGVWTDITERKQAEEQLREQTDIINRAPDAIVIRNFKDEKVTFWNKGAEQLYGWSAHEALGKSIGELIVAEPRDRAAALKLLVSAGEFYGELTQRARDGRNIVVESRETVIRNPDSAPRSVLIINTDVTEHKKLETHLLRSQRLESIGTLASGVAHDLNNILTPILVCAEMLKSNPARPDGPDLLSMIEESGRRGANVVKQVLTFARGVEGDRVLIKPSHLVQEMIDVAQKTFPKAIEIAGRYHEDIWSIKCDPTQLHQVLLNFCVNARDAMPNGGSIIIGAENFHVDEHYASMTPGASPGPHVMLRVTDTGTGMSRATMDKIFDPFFTTKEIGKGTGLGLSTALGIIKSHSGFISVYSEPGSGTTFKIFLPAQVSEADSRKSEILLESLNGNNEQILVVDDEPGILRVTKMILEQHNYRVISVNDGVDALAAFAQQRASITAILTDIMMPYVDGVALVRAVRKMDPNMIFIASTGQGEEARISELQALNVTNILAKPYDTEKLLSTLKLALNTADTSAPHERPRIRLPKIVG